MMRIFLTGANGWIGSAVVHDLIAAGHQVTGLARSPEKGTALADAGGTPLIGSLSDVELLRAAAAEADGIIHTAFGLDFSKIKALAEEERRALRALGDEFAGSDRPLIVTGGVLTTPPGEVFTEAARPPIDPDFPRASEQVAFELADRGVRAMVIRNPRSVHGQGETHGFVPMLAAVAREKRLSAWVGDGDNLWPAVHRLDSARLYCLAAEHGARGAAYHAIAEQGVAFRLIAEAIGRQLNLPATSIDPANADAHFGGLARWVRGNGPAASDVTRAALGWTPTEIGLIADIERPDYQA
jgi:nucleoside-diphosphate-sugar epimerase